MELLLARLEGKREKFEASAIMFFEGKRKKEMSSGEQSFHNLYEFFSFYFSSRLSSTKIAAWKIVQMAF